MEAAEIPYSSSKKFHQNPYFLSKLILSKKLSFLLYCPRRTEILSLMNLMKFFTEKNLALYGINNTVMYMLHSKLSDNTCIFILLNQTHPKSNTGHEGKLLMLNMLL